MKRNYTVIGLVILLMQAISAAAQGPIDSQHSDPVWQATYWNNPTLSGPPVVHRIERDLDFDWGSDSPDPIINADRFSARWTRYIKVAPGTYRFTAVADDGLRLWVDNDLIINRWQDQAPAAYTTVMYLGPGHHLLKVEYYENKGGAVAKISWLRATQSTPPSAATLSQPKTSPMMTLEVVEQFAGDVLSVATVDDLVYMGLGTRVVTVDVSDPERSEIINRSQILSGSVKDIIVKHPLAYVATGQGGLDILDLSELASLKRITNVPINGELDNLVISTNLLFGLGIQPGEDRDGPGFISIIDVTTPTHPVEVVRRN